MNLKVTPDLTGKIVLIYKTNSEHDIALQDPSFEMHNEKLFLVGIVPDGGSANDWLSGLKTHVAWDLIGEFVIFDSLEEYHARLSRAWSDKSWQ